MRKFFNRIYKNINDIKKHFRELVKVYHSDFGGTDELFREMYTEYEDLLNKFVGTSFTNIDDDNISSSLKEKLSKIVNLDDIEIEIIGKWIWVSGNTILHKDYLKELGFKFSGTHKKWYYSSNLKSHRYKSKYRMDEIKEMYTTKVVETNKIYKLS